MSTVALFAALGATWPAAEIRRDGGWTLRRGAGGGRRVSAATLDAPDVDVDIAAAEAAMRAWGQRPVFQLRPGESGLDARLAGRGYALEAPSLLLVAAAAAVADPDARAIVGDAPLAVMREIWSAGGIGPDRVAVMARVACPRAYLLGRAGDTPAACGFVALDGATVMLHALEVAAPFRRIGLGSALTRAAAAWGADHGAKTLALAVTAGNIPARTAYARLGFAEAAAYHYRLAPEDPNGRPAPEK